MNTFWLKLRIWTKIIAFSLVLLYVVIFILSNGDDVKIWYWFRREPITVPVVLLIAGVLLIGVVGTLLARMMYRTFAQIREAKAKGQAAQLQHDLADMKTKAAMLQTRPQPEPPPPAPSPEL